jgi:hypothetical protein
MMGGLIDLTQIRPRKDQPPELGLATDDEANSRIPAKKGWVDSWQDRT